MPFCAACASDKGMIQVKLADCRERKKEAIAVAATEALPRALTPTRKKRLADYVFASMDVLPVIDRKIEMIFDK